MRRIWNAAFRWDHCVCKSTNVLQQVEKMYNVCHFRIHHRQTIFSQWLQCFFVIPQELVLFIFQEGMSSCQIGNSFVTTKVNSLSSIVALKKKIIGSNNKAHLLWKYASWHGFNVWYNTYLCVTQIKKISILNLIKTCCILLRDYKKTPKQSL